MKTKTLRWLAAMLLLVAAMVIPARGNAVTLTYLEGSNGVNNNENADKLFDGDTKTKWCCKVEPSAYVVFRASEPCKLNGYTITTANDNAEYTKRNPKDWKIYGSHDQKTWTELVSVSNDTKLQAVNYTAYEYTLNPGIATPYIYYKWEITADHGDEHFQVSEFSISAADWDWVKTDGLQGGAFEYKYKVAILPSNDITLGTIQKPEWAFFNAGIHIIFPNDLAFGDIRINGAKTDYAVQGAGVCLYLSNFTEELTEVQVMDPKNQSIKWTLYVYYVKPVMLSASEAYVTQNAAVLNVAGKENGNNDPVTRFKVVETSETYTATNGQITITGLTPGTAYSFTISAVDAVGKESDNTITVPVTTLLHPYPAPAPTHAPDQVFSIYSDAYTSAVTRATGYWGQQTKEQELALAEGDNAFYYTDCNYLGWELNNNTTIGDMSLFPNLHMDIYVLEAGTIKFSPVWRDEEGTNKKEVLKEYNLTQGWNALDIDLAADFAGINLKNIYQLKWDDMPAVCYIDNVYFWVEFFIIYHHDDMPKDPEDGAVTQYAGGPILQPIQYKRKFTPGVWETLCVPFEVDSITVYDPGDRQNYNLYAQYRNGETVKEGEFWLRTFDAVASEVTQANFQSNWQDIKADSREKALPVKNKPYIMRVPDVDGYYNDKYIVFHGKGGQTIDANYSAPELPEKDGYFSYSGNNTMQPWNLENAYVLDAQGVYFRADKTVTLNPFECAVNATQATRLLYPRLMISSPQITTADGLPSTEYEGGRIYTTMGVLVGTFETLDEEENCVMHLPEGIYIVQRRQAISKIHISK